MSTRVTLATSTGPLWVVLASHYAAGLISIATGFAALAVAKGGMAHKRVGLVFTWSMVYMCLSATGIALYAAKYTSVFAGVISAYLVVTATTTVRPLRFGARHADIGLMILAFALSSYGLWGGIQVLGLPGRQLNGVPAGMILFMNSVVMLAAIGDARMIRAGSITGTRRVARHLWRMCFALFIASGSFFLGQMKFVPEPIRILPLLLLLAFAPLLALLYWMWRVRLRRKLAGMIVHDTPVAAQ